MTGFSSDTSGAARTSAGGGRGLREISVIHSALRDLEERPPDQLAGPRMRCVLRYDHLEVHLCEIRDGHISNHGQNVIFDVVY